MSNVPETTQRTLVIWIVMATLIALGVVAAVLDIGGRPDPPELRAAAPLLDGAWRFHLGDDPHWASLDADDSAWETINLSAPASSNDGDVGLPNYAPGWRTVTPAITALHGIDAR
jgi:hypothetical protein